MPEPEPPSGRFSPRSRSPLFGFTFCFLWGVGLKQIIDSEFLDPLGSGYFSVLLGVAGTLLYPTRARKAIDGGIILTVAALIAIGYTPLIHSPALSWIQSDPLKPCPAVVILSSEVGRDGTLNATGEDRLLKGLELIHRHYAGRLVITRLTPPSPSGLPAVETEMADLGIIAPVFQVGPVKNTHDEALKVADLARSRHWKRILLVTSPFHTRRARAVFAKTGLEIIVQPSPERGYDLVALEKESDRYKAFRYWLKEVIGYRIYQARGWIR